MPAFYDRERELARLEAWWDGPEPELITTFGRRQVGKTELLIRFLADKPAVYFYADRQVVSEHLRQFTEQVLRLYDDPVLRVQPFASWEAALTYVLRLGEQRRIAVVLDEFSYAAASDPTLPSVIQRLWDTARRSGNRTYFVLCSSFTEAAERYFNADGPLYRRRTRELRVEPFDYRDAARFFDTWPLDDRVRGWGVAGGVPSYLQALRATTFAEAVVEHMLDKSALLYREAETLLTQEVRGVGAALLRSLLTAVAYGCTEPNQMAQRVGRPVTGISGALGFLMDYGLIERVVPYDVPNPERSRRGRYRLHDNYLQFWFRFVLPNRSELEAGHARAVWERRVAPEIDRYMGARFEALCRQFIRRHPERFRHPPPELGVWWHADDELELVGHAGGLVHLVGEAKWTGQPVGRDVLRTLERRAAMLSRVAPDRQLALFARSGFTPDLMEAAGPDLLLFTLDDLFA